ncbi:unnamed protein product [Notodromas monacha]|uniref:Death-associated protein 1 n=1 Tax=Notodromas monacha TaxID=399045 RepID=A0A7R9BJR5_9CRUS|nr:unnamed protein product [Notodromas monacha]CAG0916511.1 unnamed protein product [Notodromas monacha]
MASAQVELKAGHPPAIKAGGMRITQHKTTKEDKAKTNGEEVATGTSPKSSPLVIAGAVVKGDAEFPPEAVQKFHTKPEPSHVERRNSGGHKPIHQPRK